MLKSYISETQSLIDSLIRDTFPATKPHYLYDPISYTLTNGGKKIRPVLLRIVASYVGASSGNALACAAGVELFHIFSLVHDDIMDNDSLRRGKETVHVRWDNATAILAGDGLIAMANMMIGKAETENFRELVNTYNKAVLDVCEGQAFDKEYENRAEVSLDEYLNMIRLKTACLLGASAKLGALAGNANTELADKFYKFGINLGLAFQVQDDILDLYADEATLGKDIGSDVKNNKKSVLTLIAQQENINFNMNAGESSDDFILRIKSIFEDQGVLAKAQELKSDYTEKAKSFVASLEAGEAKELLNELVEKLNVRQS